MAIGRSTPHSIDISWSRMAIGRSTPSTNIKSSRMSFSHCYCYSSSRQINWQSSYVVGFHSTPADHLTLHLQICPPLKQRSLHVILRNMQCHIDMSNTQSHIDPVFRNMEIVMFSLSLSLWPFMISIVKAHTIRCQIYPNEVFYVKDLLPMMVTI